MAVFMRSDKHTADKTNQYAYLRDTLERRVFLPPATVALAFLFAEFVDRPSLPVHLGIRRDGIRVLEMAVVPNLKGRGI